MRARRIIQEELFRLTKGIIVVAVSGAAIVLIVKSIGVKKFGFIESALGMSIWGFVGMLAFLIAWAVVYREDIKKIPKLLSDKGKKE
ncbi:hypothetical protein [Archaeoglobus neptunius]|uniref:hypothetical protein n=1 Tax=Archaeoglobus neptunius TaxID=2798580 RepID=UPI001E528AC8|nr:hypothetical protein [Archaeoglobus neptunius]